MSKRRAAGNWVWLKPNSGFIGRSHLLKAEIQPEEDNDTPCFECDDPDCREWVTLFTAPDDNGERHMLCHVPECRMLDEPYEDDAI